MDVWEAKEALIKGDKIWVVHDWEDGKPVKKQYGLNFKEMVYFISEIDENGQMCKQFEELEDCWFNEDMGYGHTEMEAEEEWDLQHGWDDYDEDEED